MSTYKIGSAENKFDMMYICTFLKALKVKRIPSMCSHCFTALLHNNIQQFQFSIVSINI